jgi:hypothetical protein
MPVIRVIKKSRNVIEQSKNYLSKTRNHFSKKNNKKRKASRKNKVLHGGAEHMNQKSPEIENRANKRRLELLKRTSPQSQAQAQAQKRLQLQLIASILSTTRREVNKVPL